MHLRRWLRFHFAVIPQPRLYFRLSLPGRCAPSFSPKPLTSLSGASPTHSGVTYARTFAGGTRFIFRRGQVCCRLRLFSPPGTWLTQWLLTAHSVSHLHPFHRRLRAFLAEAPLLSASAKKRYGLRVDRLRPPDCLRFPPIPLLRHGVGPRRLHLQSQTIFDGYVTAFAATPPTSGYWHASTPLSTRNLRLLFRAVDDGLLRSLLHSRLSHTDSHVPPTRRGRSRQHSKPSAVFITRLRRLLIERAGCVASLSAYATM